MATVTFNCSKDGTMVKAVGGTFSGWTGSDNHLSAGEFYTGNWKARSVVYFPISFTGMVSITSAIMYVRYQRTTGLHCYGDLARSIGLYAARMTKDWGEEGGGESSYTGTQAWHWDTRFDTYSTTGQVLKTGTIDSGDFRDGYWTSIDVTGIVQSWFTGSSNYGIMLRNQDETTFREGLEFGSREQGTSWRPYIVIDYATNVAPNAPISLAPTGDAIVQSVSPTYSGTRADPDAGDYITAAQIQTFKDDSTTLYYDSGTITMLGTPTSFSIAHGTLGSGGVIHQPIVGNAFHRWKARTRDKGSAWGPYSALQRFKANTPPNAAGLQLVETPASDITTQTPSLTITHSDNDATDNKMYGYRIILEKQSGTSWLAEWDTQDVDTSGAAAAISKTVVTSQLAWGSTFRAKARTKDINGAWGTYSGYVTFSTHSTAPPINLAPSSDETISGLVPVFTGDRASTNDTISQYRIITYLQDGITILSDSGDISTGITNGASFSKTYTGSALSYGTTYKWKARITSSVGTISAYSALQTFSTPTDVTVPTQNLPTPNNGSRVTSLTPTFTGTRSSATFNTFQIEFYPSTATTTNLGTPLRVLPAQAMTTGNSYSWTYSGSPALAWNITYKWRVRVSSDTGSSWSSWTGLAAFSTDAAGGPTLTQPTASNQYWQTTLTPTLAGSATGTDLIAKIRYLVKSATGSVTIWDSGWVTSGGTATFSTVYGTAGVGASPAVAPTLVSGTTYQWQAQYEKTTGPTGSFSSLASFHINGAPLVPSTLRPSAGEVVPDTLYPKFEATFDDPEKADLGDYPTKWVIEIRNNETNTIVATKTRTTGLVAGLNSYTWTSEDAGFAYGTVYKWITWFEDSKLAVGAASGAQTFSFATAPNGVISSPSNGSTPNTFRPPIIWSYSSVGGQAQQSYLVEVFRTSDNVRVWSTNAISSATSITVAGGYLRNKTQYRARLTVTDVNGLSDPSPSETVFTVTLEAPNAVTGLSPYVNEERSYVLMDWDTYILKTGHTFVRFNVYRRLTGDTEWLLIGTRAPMFATAYIDWYTGQGITYEYLVTAVTITSQSGVDLESPDSDMPEARLQSDSWMIVGRDRSEEHAQAIPVTDEEHNRIVQQEIFEVVGGTRKVVIRGNTLGYEGTLTIVWDSRDIEWPEASQRYVDYTLVGKRLLDYVLENAGPHILKSPFGDVWEVEFQGPSYRPATGGHLEVEMAWIETGIGQKQGSLE